jgi:hypothetical protein
MSHTLWYVVLAVVFVAIPLAVGAFIAAGDDDFPFEADVPDGDNRVFDITGRTIEDEQDMAS